MLHKSPLSKPRKNFSLEIEIVKVEKYFETGVSCGNPERAAGCQAVQDKHQDGAAAEPLGCREEQGTGARGWEQKEASHSETSAERGEPGGGDVINRV